MLNKIQFESQTTYTFLEEIGQGGMGIVYLAERNSGGVADYVVLKTLKSLTPEDEETLRQEANMAALLRHENIVKTYGLESIPLSSLPHKFLERLGALSYLKQEASSQSKLRRLQFKKKSQSTAEPLIKTEQDEKKLLLIVMDYIDGINLRSFHFEHICQGLLIPVLFGAFIISRIARALFYAHNYLIHRDVSPENILINTQGICKLSDFGIAVATRKQPDYWAGKLSFMAPEQLKGEPIDERIDIFSLGSVAYQIITGIPLVEVPPEQKFEKQVQSVKEQLERGIVPPARIRPDIPEVLSNIIMKMVAPLPHKRYQKANEVANVLEKEFLYAKGYGPTNNSLASYLHIFETKFTSYNEEQLEQMSFLKNSAGEVEIRRRLEPTEYTPEGLALIEQRKESEIYKRLKLTKQIRQVQVLKGEERLAYLKIKYLDNVIEAYQIENGCTIGSSPKMDIYLEDKKIREHHCTILCNNNSVWIRSIHPDSLVSVNGTPVLEQEIRNGDKIKIGDYLLFFIKQRSPAWTESHKISLDQEVSLQSLVDTAQEFTVSFIPGQQGLTRMARLVDLLLAKTDLSELKLGIIPTAVVESIQLLKGSDTHRPFEIRISKSSVRLIFTCLSLNRTGYELCLNNFKKHRQRLAEELAQKEKAKEEAEAVSDPSVFDNLTSRLEKNKAEKSQSKESEEPILPEIDPTMFAAMLMVHGFDRIEFQREKKQVDLVVYL